MEYIIKNLQQTETADIYMQWIHRHFPQSEIKPLKKIQSMWDEGAYHALGMYEKKMNNQEQKQQLDLIGYAFFVTAPECNILLLDYFAIVEDYRSQGMGSIFLKEMKKYLDGYKSILIETEDVDCAQNEEELRTREKRNRFYKRSGAVMAGIKSNVYGVNYDIWNFPLTESSTRKECKDCLESIYRIIASGEEYNKYVKIEN